MNEEPKVSIIIGCYNVERWLRNGRLNDIYNQTFKDWELILVDDGSTDETPTLLDAEAKNDSRIIVIHKRNGGLGSARNAGLDIARGKYVWSFDLDDHVDSKCIEYCVKEADNRQVDVLMFGFNAITVNVNKNRIEKIQLCETLINTNRELRDSYLDRILFVPNGNGFFWNKFYKRSFIEKNKLRFGNQRIQQDECFNLKVYMYLEKCYISPKVFYDYYIYNNGNNRSKFLPNRFDIYKSVRHHFEQLKTFWRVEDSRFVDYLNNRFYNGVMQCVIFNLLHFDCTWTKKRQKEEMDRIMNDPLTMEAFNYAEKHYCSIEQKLYRMACRHKSLCAIKLLNKIFEIMRVVKKVIIK